MPQQGTSIVGISLFGQWVLANAAGWTIGFSAMSFVIAPNQVALNPDSWQAVPLPHFIRVFQKIVAASSRHNRTQ